MKTLLFTIVACAAISACAGSVADTRRGQSENVVGWIGVEIKQGTNVIENVALTRRMKPSLNSILIALSNDTVVIDNKSYRYDGKKWDCEAPSSVKIPTDKKIIYIRTASQSSTWTIPGEVDTKKLLEQYQQQAK